VVWSTGDQEAAFAEAGLAHAQALLILGEDDLHNLQAAVVGNALAPAVPVVLRIFNPVLAEQFGTGLNVRRAYSVSALSAPVFVASALGEDVVQTLHLGDDEVALCRVAVNRGSPLAGRTAEELERDFHLALLARGRTAEDWETATGDLRIGQGDHLIVRPSGLHRRMRRPAATLLPALAAILGGCWW
jgi:Trk K+ transport system NAD-binding subunit